MASDNKLEEGICKLKNELVNVKAKYSAILSDIFILKNAEIVLSQEIIEVETNIKTEKENSQNLSLKVADIQWQQTKAIISADCEKINIDMYINIMESLEKSSESPINSLDNAPVDKIEDQSECIYSNSTPSQDIYTTDRKIGLEAAVAQHRFNVIECQEMNKEAMGRHATIVKRNAATLLRLRKNLQDSENARKEIVENINTFGLYNK